MTEIVVPLASANASKAVLIQGFLGRQYQVRCFDPGDAEERHPMGYEEAAIAKATAAVGLHALEYAVGHDSGFEFECLGGEPGPATHRRLRAQGLKDFIAELVPGSALEVVHCIALVDKHGESRSFLGRDRRRVRTYVDVSHLSATLPLGDVVEGQTSALRRALEEACALGLFEMRKS